jgi:hypothetical protein
MNEAKLATLDEEGLRALSREVVPQILTFLERAQYDAERYGIPASALLIHAPVAFLSIMERHTRKTDIVKALGRDLFFLLYPHTPLQNGKVAFTNLMRRAEEHLAEPIEIHSAILGIEPHAKGDPMTSAQQLLVTLWQGVKKAQKTAVIHADLAGESQPS